MQLVRRDADKGYLDTLMWVPKHLVNADGLKAALSFTFFDNREPTVLKLWRETRHHIVIPREFWSVDELKIPMVDCRPLNFPRRHIRSKIQLDHRPVNGVLEPTGATVQRDALHAVLSARGGILQLGCGKGKTVIALEAISRLEVPALVVVDNTQLLHQWKEEILRHLDVTEDDIGLIQGDVFDWKKPIVLATYQTLALRAAAFPEEARRWFGVTVWDEAHHVAAPTFARSVDLFYGRRYGLTATPERSDGLQVIYAFHIGPVLFKDLSQDLKPDIAFLWTGLEIDVTDPQVRPYVCDCKGELHLGKLAGYFGRWRTRLDFILNKVTELLKQNRKILVLSNSVAEICNLVSIWTWGPVLATGNLYTDIPIPTPADVGETELPALLEPRDEGRLKHRLGSLIGQLKDPLLNPVKRFQFEDAKKEILKRLKQHTVAELIGKELKRRQHKYIKTLITSNVNSTAGFFLHRVKPEERMKMLKEKEVIFAITKYGREGLDDPSLDTLMVCEPITDPGGLKQMMGRTQRKKEGKQKPLVLFLEDNIGLIIGMCNKLRSHLRSWPTEEGGPYDFDRIGHPNNRRRLPTWATQRLVDFG